MISDDEKKSTDDSRSRDLSPGKLLVWARERANLSQEQVAKELYMTLTKVRSLEMDDYRHMGADTFVRGYLRAYANLVHLDVPQILAAYDRFLQKTGAVEQAFPRKAESETKPIWQFALALVIALLVIWLISIWFFDNRQQTVINRPAPLVPQLDIRQVPTSISASSVSFSAESAVAVEATAGIASQDSTTSAPAQLQESSAENPESAAFSSISSAMSDDLVASVAPTALALITLTFSAECWLEVSDARGDVLAADLQAAGSSVQLQGQAPFDVKLGNAPAASILFNGKPVKVTPLPSTNVLSLKVGQ